MSIFLSDSMITVSLREENTINKGNAGVQPTDRKAGTTERGFWNTAKIENREC